MSQIPARLALRLETGERRGEIVPIPDGGLTVGRRPENDLVLVDPSVSGRHALLRLDKGRLWVEDLDSTNGTKLGGRAIGRTAVEVGDRLAFGTVECLVLDGAAAAPAAVPAKAAFDAEELLLEDDPAPRATAPSIPARPARRAAPAVRAAPDVAEPVAVPSGEALGEVETLSTERLARARSRGGPLALIGAVAVVAAAVGAFVWHRMRTDASEGASTAAVATARAIAGNLVADGSFEESGDAWRAPEGSAPLEIHRAFAASGRAGAGFDGGERGSEAALVGDAVNVRAGQRIAFGGTMRASGGYAARIAIAFVSSSDAERRTVVLGPLVRDVESATERSATIVVPAGHDRAQLVLWAGASEDARDDGEAAFDDVFVRAETGDAPAPLAAVGDWRFHAITDDELLVFRFDRLAARVRVAADAMGPGAALDVAPLDGERGVRITHAAGGRVGLSIAGELYARAVASLADRAAGGLRTHPPRFEREGATALLVGEGVDQVRFGFESPKALAAAPEAGWLAVTAEPASRGAIEVQVAFQKERAEAQRIASEARAARSQRDALAAWNALLERFPFEAELVREAESARGRAVQEGLEALRAVEADAERARFFALAELVVRAADEARDVARRFGGSEVEERALALAAALDVEAASLARDRNDERRAALTAMRDYFARTEADALRDRVDEALRAVPASTGDGSRRD